MIRAVNSLAGRALLASILLLPAFLGVTGYYLERSYRLSIEAAQSERLQLLMFTLLAEAEFDRELHLPGQLLEARFNQPDSGLYALITAASGDSLWVSPSALIRDSQEWLIETPDLAVGDKYFARGERLFSLSYKVAWQTEGATEVPLVFTVLETVSPADAQLAIYRWRLMFWLGGSALLLIACQALILYWGLRPLRKLAQQIADIESGTAEGLDDSYPREVQPVTKSLNTLLSSEKKRRERVRNTLSDLAHSLKTPLAVIRNANPQEHDYGQLVQDQTLQMEEIVGYHLQRAVGGSHKLLQVVRVAPVVERLKASLLKVYADKHLSIGLEIEPGCVFRGDERDLLELVGSLLDNACKYGRTQVLVRATGGGSEALFLTVEDDGEGIPLALHDAILERGVRADGRQSGQGIGLSVATDLVETYLGSLELAESTLGGALVRVALP